VLSLQIVAHNSTTIANCSAFCAANFYSLAIISPDWLCRCSMQLPDEVNRWTHVNCTTHQSADGGDGAAGTAGTPAAVYYLHSGAHLL
jgi:hypothetical protein